MIEARDIAFLLGPKGGPRLGEPMIREQLEFARRHGLLQMEMSALQGMGMMAGHRGNRAEAQEYIEKGRAIGIDLGLRLDATAWHGDALIDWWAGDIEVVVEKLTRAYRGLTELGEKGFFSTVATELALALLDLGEVDEAEQVCRVAEEAGAADDITTQVELTAARARILARRGSLADAEAKAREAVARAEEVEYFMLPTYARLALGEVLRFAGRPAEAAEQWRMVMAAEEMRGNELFVSRLRRELAEIEAEAAAAQQT